MLLFYLLSCRAIDEHVVPFRESKLTSLFQNYFIGKGEGARKGSITMFVNVSNNASAFDETFHVLKFSALTSKVGWILLVPLALAPSMYVGGSDVVCSLF